MFIHLVEWGGYDPPTSKGTAGLQPGAISISATTPYLNDDLPCVLLTLEELFIPVVHHF